MLKELLSQRVFGIALGYEDLNDHDQLRHDPLMAVLAGQTDPSPQEGFALAGQLPTWLVRGAANEPDNQGAGACAVPNVAVEAALGEISGLSHG